MAGKSQRGEWRRNSIRRCMGASDRTTAIETHLAFSLLLHQPHGVLLPTVGLGGTAAERLLLLWCGLVRPHGPESIVHHHPLRHNVVPTERRDVLVMLR